MSPDIAYMILHNGQSDPNRQQQSVTVKRSRYQSLTRIAFTAAILILIFVVAGCSASAQQAPNFKDSEHEAQFVEAGFEYGCPPYFCG